MTSIQADTQKAEMLAELLLEHLKNHTIELKASVVEIMTVLCDYLDIEVIAERN